MGSQLLTEMERGLLLLALSPHLLTAFRTENCSHHHLQEAITQFEACVDQTVTVNICSAFAQLDICFPRYMSSCLPAPAVQEVTVNAKAVLRKAMEMILSDHQQQYGGF